MANQTQIQDLILLSDGYSIELTNDMLLEQKKGCLDCCDSSAIMRLIILKEQLIYKMSIVDYGAETSSLYSCLLSAIANYSGASIAVDPNSVTPNTTVVVNIIGNDSPYEITIPFADFIDNSLPGRIRYENPAWAGWLPMLAIDNMPFLVEGVDFVYLSTGGFELLPNGNVPALYNGQLMRSVGYEPYVAPAPNPPVIVEQPSTPIFKVVGDNTTFIVTATNETAYQWFKGAVAISGETTNSLTLLNVQLADAGTYKVRVFNGSEFVDSNNVVLDVTIGNYLNNQSDEKSDGTPNGAGRSVTLITASGTTSISVNSSAGPFANGFITIRQNGADSLTLKCDAFSAPLLNGNVDNNFDLSTFTSPYIFVYNNN